MKKHLSKIHSVVLRKFHELSDPGAMKMCRRTASYFRAHRKSLISRGGAVLLVVLFFSMAGTYILDHRAERGVYAAELSFMDISPKGIAGGKILPASCESGAGEGGVAHFDGDTSGFCDGLCHDTTAFNYLGAGACTYLCSDSAATNYNQVGACAYLPAPSLSFSPASVTYGAGGTVVWSWPETGGTRYCNINTYGSEWNGFATYQDISGSYTPGGMNASGSATAICYWYRPSTASYLASPQANATLVVGPKPTGCAYGTDAAGTPLTVVSDATPEIDRGTLSGNKYTITKFGAPYYCFGQTTGPKYYIPIGTKAEMDAFWNNIEAGSSLSGLYRIP